MTAEKRAMQTVLSLLLAAGAGAPSAPAAPQTEQKIVFALRDTAGAEHALARYAGRIVVLEFWSFKCPSSLAYRDRMAALYERYRGRGVVFLAVASNRNESPEEIARNAANLKMPYPVLLDTEGMAAEKLGAVRTPSVFILDGAGMLRYRGAPDNNKAPGQPGREAYAEEAIEALLAGRPVPRPQTDELGCAIRRTER